MSGVSLNAEERRFLEAIATAERPATRGRLPAVTRAQDAARQSCRKRGLAAYEGTAHGWTREGWVLTPAGRGALSPPTQETDGGR